MAEVTITFEDDEGRFDGHTEIDISRRLTLDIRGLTAEMRQRIVARS